MKTKKLLGIAAAIAALGLGSAGSAQAISYGVSMQNVTNGQIIFSDIQNVTGGVLAGGTTQSNTSANVGSTVAGDTQTLARGSLPPADALCANVGIGCTQNANVSAVLGGVTGNYARADAQVVSEQLALGDSFAAKNFAEYYLNGTQAAGGLGGNGSTTGFVLNFAVVGAPGGTADMTFSFNNDPYMKVFLDALGGSASAAITAILTLSNDAGTEFTWRPDGTSGALAIDASLAAGASDTDFASLNKSQPLTVPVGAPIVYAPGSGFWSLTIDNLKVGNYSVALEMEERARGSNIPEPGTLALAGLGLMMLGGARRRKS